MMDNDAQLMAEPCTLGGHWLVYMIEATDGSLYTGITTDIARRWQQHSNGQGARYFRGRTPKALRLLESYADRSTASRREYQIKQLNTIAKRQLIASQDQALWPQAAQSLA